MLSIAFDPFVQNLVGYYTKNKVEPSQNTLVSNNSVYDTDPLFTNNCKS